jgi:hypothetical protein
MNKYLYKIIGLSSFSSEDKDFILVSYFALYPPKTGVALYDIEHQYTIQSFLNMVAHDLDCQRNYLYIPEYINFEKVGIKE